MASENVDSHAEAANERNLALLGPDDVVGMSFTGCEEAYEFYNSYARVLGFSTRAQDRRKKKSDSTISMKEWSCSKQSQRRKEDLNEINRKREPREHTRCGCLAKMRILCDDSSLAYRVTKFVLEHNHDLMPQRLVHYLPSHRKISDGDRAQILSMHEADVKPRQIMEYMTNLAGGRANLGYGIKQLYSIWRSHSMQEITNGDHMLSS